MDLEDRTIGIVGLGYVGLPLAVEFARRRKVLGFDRDAARIDALRSRQDSTGEVDAADLASVSARLALSADLGDLARCGIFIVCVPTPVDAAKRPDLGPLVAACETVGRAMAEGAVVIFESTVYPGCTEEICVPILERLSGLVFNEGFVCGYSPERVNPGDRRHRIPDIVKVTSGSTPEAAEAIDALYASIVAAGTHRAASIRVAEAAKVIENTQRDLNIALMNELALIFHRLGIDTTQVLEAAGTKWNFLPFRPGLVGGHCIGVDPYYLTHKAQEVGYYPEVILSGRRINDGVGAHVADRVVKLMLERRIAAFEARVLVLGLAFKENCRDTRNSRVVDTVRALEGFHARVEVFDPCVDAADAVARYGLAMLETLEGAPLYDGIVLAVAHDAFAAMGAQGIRALLKPGGVLFDVKAMLPIEQSDGRL